MGWFSSILIIINHAETEGFFPWEGQNLGASDMDLVAYRKASIQKAFLLSSLGKVSQVHETEENHGRHLFEMQLYQDRVEKVGPALILPFQF